MKFLTIIIFCVFLIFPFTLLSEINSTLSTLAASTFLGGTNLEGGWPRTPIVVDDFGNVYVAGQTGSSNFPFTKGAFDSTRTGGVDVFVAKFNNDLSTLLASTFLGGRGHDKCYALALDPAGNVVITGVTESSDFPVTSGGYNQNLTGNSDVFISKLSADLTTLVASTYFGGTNEDEASTIAIDDAGNIIIAGRTKSSNLPTTPGVFDRTFNNSDNVFLSIFNADLSTLTASSFLGQSCADDYPSLVLDGDNNIYVAGTTASKLFPVSDNAYNKNPNGRFYGYISLLNNDLTTVLASTFLGGNELNFIYFVTLDEIGNVLVGCHADQGFPTTPIAFNQTFNGSWADAAIAKFDKNLTTLKAATFLGGNDNECVMSIFTDKNNNIYASGYTESTDFPASLNAFQSTPNGKDDAFIAIFDSNLSQMSGCTFLGGSRTDEGNSIIQDKNGNLFIAGATGSSDFSTTPGVYNESYNGGNTFSWGGDIFISKFSNVTATSSKSQSKVMLLEDYRLLDNFPNPFNPTTKIKYHIRSAGHVELTIFDITGKTVATLIAAFQQPGSYTVEWDGMNKIENQVAPSGTYFYRLKGGNVNITKKMLFIK